MPVRVIKNENGTNKDVPDSDTVQLGTVVLSGDFGVGTTDQFGSGSVVIGVANATTAPTTNPTGGGVMYAEAGAGKWRGSSGTVTTFGTADPHCPVCDRDCCVEWVNEEKGWEICVCIWCLTEAIGDVGVIEKKQRAKGE